MSLSLKYKNKNIALIKPPRLILVFFAIIFVFSTINLFRDLNASGIRPLAFAGEAIERIAQAVGIEVRITDQPERPLSDKGIIADNMDRCLVHNPKTGAVYKSKTGLAPLSDGKGGINQGSVVGGGHTREIDFVQGDNSINQDLNMGYILSIATSPDQVDAAVQFINDSNNSGLMPVLRLCYPGGCNFKIDSGPQVIVDFFKDVSSKIDSGFEFVALLGPNEPGTAGEKEAFFFSPTGATYAALVTRANMAAEALQSYRTIQGGNMYLAPAAFNIGNREQDDVKEYLYNNVLQIELFDYLLGNVYEFPGLGAYKQYEESGMKEYVESNDIQVILTEFGAFNGASIAETKKSFNLFCEDPFIDGIMFFRSFEELPAPQPKPDSLTTRDIADMTQGCSKLRDWVNCNLDSAVYPEPAGKVPMTSKDNASAAPSCSHENPNQQNHEAWLWVKFAADTNSVNGCDKDCNGNASFVKTTQLKVPAKQFGSNSPIGTRTKPFMSISAEVGTMLQDVRYDAFNQFAGEIMTSDGKQLGFPALGSAINNASQLSLYSQEYQRFAGLQAYPSPGSFRSNAKAEIQSDLERLLGKDVSIRPEAPFLVFDNKNYIPDERAIVYNKTFNFDKSDFESVDQLRPYDPFRVSTNYKKPDPMLCSSSTAKYLDNKDDYIIGPEYIDSTGDAWNGNGPAFCLQWYGNIDPSKKFLSTGGTEPYCEVLGNNTISQNFMDPNIPGLVLAPAGTSCSAFPQLYQCLGGNPSLCSGHTVRTLANDCLTYRIQATDEISLVDKGYPSISPYKISNIYDALYRGYQRLQDELKDRNKRIIFRENIAWKVDINSIIRDSNRVIEAQTYPYYYEGTDEEKVFDFMGSTGKASQPALFKNDIVYARKNPIKKHTQYFDWLGYLDPIQEIRTVYANSTVPGDEEIDNPFYNPNDPNLPNNTKRKITVANIGNVFIGFSLPTCDQVEIGKKYTSEQLPGILTGYFREQGFSEDISTAKANDLAAQMWPDDDPREPDVLLPSDAALTCITDVQDTRFENGLEKELCKRRYSIEGVCNDVNKCIPTQNYGDAIGKYETGDYEGGACPSSECPAQLAAGQGGFAYPSCNQQIQTTNTGADTPGNCAYYQNQEKYFGPASSAGDKQVSLNELSRAQDGDGFLGMGGSIPIHQQAAAIFLRAEQQFNQLYGANRKGATYFLPSYPNGYTFIFARSYSAGSGLGSVPSNHAFGVAIDISATTNWGNFRPQQGACIIDIPPELVQVFEANGIRWGGRFAKYEHVEGERGYFDPMHFELLPDCAPELIDLPANPNPLQPGVDLPPFACPVDDNQATKEYDTIFDLIEAVGESTGLDKELLASIMSTESRSSFEVSIGEFIRNNTAKYSGDPYDEDDINSGVAIGPMQIIEQTFNSLKNNARYSNPIMNCVRDIGMNEVSPSQLRREYVGHALCMAAILLKDTATIEGLNLNNVDVGNMDPDYVITNPVWKVARRYYCGYVEDNGGRCDLGDAYGNQTWGRYSVFALNWDKYVSGEWGFQQLQDYLITLGQN